MPPVAALSLFEDFLRQSSEHHAAAEQGVAAGVTPIVGFSSELTSTEGAGTGVEQHRVCGGGGAPLPTAVGPTMAVAIDAAERRWAAERRTLDVEVAMLRKQRSEDAQVMGQTATLVQMLQVPRAPLRGRA